MPENEQQKKFADRPDKKGTTEACRFHPDRQARARKLCSNCYSHWHRGKLDVPELAVQKRQGPEIKPVGNTHSLHFYAKRMLGRVITPQRIEELLLKAYQRAKKNDKVLMWLLGYVLPEKEQKPQLNVVINSPLMKQQEGITYDTTGEQINEE